MTRRFWLGLAVTLVAGVMPLSADEGMGLMGCLPEIQKACFGLEDQMETCLEERTKDMSDVCRKELKNAIELAKDPGLAACVNDVQRLCKGKDITDMGACIQANVNSFSNGCQEYLKSSIPTD